MSLDEILWCGNSNETSFAVSSHGAIQTHPMESHNNFPGEEGVKGQIFKIRMRLYFTGRCRVPWRGAEGGRWQVTPIKLLGGGGGNCAWIFSRITHYHKGSLGLSHTGILCFEVAHIMNLNFLLMYFVELHRCMNFKPGKFVWIPSFSGWKLSRNTMKWLRDWRPKSGHCWRSYKWYLYFYLHGHSI